MKLKYCYKSNIMKINVFEEEDELCYLEGNLTSLHMSFPIEEKKYHVDIDYYGESLWTIIDLHTCIGNYLDSEENFYKFIKYIETLENDSFVLIYGNRCIIEGLKDSNDTKYTQMVKKYIEENYDRN